MSVARIVAEIFRVK